MTNAEKFKEVFGFYVDVDKCPRVDEDCASCVGGGFACERSFWQSEYKDEPAIPLSVIEDIKAEIRQKQ